MANTFGSDVLIQAEDPVKAANFYVKEPGFEVTDKKPNMVSLHVPVESWFCRCSAKIKD